MPKGVQEKTHAQRLFDEIEKQIGTTTTRIGRKLAVLKSKKHPVGELQRALSALQKTAKVELNGLRKLQPKRPKAPTKRKAAAKAA